MAEKVRDLVVDTDTKARLENQAFLTRSSVSELVREILDGIARDEYTDAVEKNPLPPSGGGSNRARIGLIVDDQLWDAAEETAWKRRTSRSALVRLVADHLYGHLPVDREGLSR